MKYLQILALLFLVSISCKEEQKSVSSEIEKTKIEVVENDNTSVKKLDNLEKEYAKQSVNKATAKMVSDVLKEKYKDDLTLMSANDKKFQFYKIDLNNDGKQEVMVRFLTSYFCGTGGCSFLLLDHQGKTITEFSETRAPIWAEQTFVNGRQTLMVKEGGRFKTLIYKNGTYPSNPSMIKSDPENYAPSGHAEIMFDDYFAKPKRH